MPKDKCLHCGGAMIGNDSVEQGSIPLCWCINTPQKDNKPTLPAEVEERMEDSDLSFEDRHGDMSINVNATWEELKTFITQELDTQKQELLKRVREMIETTESTVCQTVKEVKIRKQIGKEQRNYLAMLEKEV